MPTYIPTAEDKLYLMHARSYEQFAHMRNCLEDNRCPFCHPHDDHVPLVRETPYWILKANIFPYSHLQNCLVFFPKKHLTRIAELSAEHWHDYGVMINWAIRHYQIPGGGLFMRFDDPRYHVGTVPHLHGHILVPDLTGEVKLTLAKKPERIRELEICVEEMEARWRKERQEKMRQPAMT